jgi:hypothetical protein
MSPQVRSIGAHHRHHNGGRQLAVAHQCVNRHGQRPNQFLHLGPTAASSAETHAQASTPRGRGNAGAAIWGRGQLKQGGSRPLCASRVAGMPACSGAPATSAMRLCEATTRGRPGVQWRLQQHGVEDRDPLADRGVRTGWRRAFLEGGAHGPRQSSPGRGCRLNASQKPATTEWRAPPAGAPARRPGQDGSEAGFTPCRRCEVRFPQAAVACWCDGERIPAPQ